jgi:hypothetical protein
LDFDDSIHQLSLFVELIENRIRGIRWFDDLDGGFQEVVLMSPKQNWLSGDIGFNVNAIWQVGETGCMEGLFESIVLDGATSLRYEMDLLAVKKDGSVINPGIGTTPNTINGEPTRKLDYEFWGFTACYQTAISEIKYVEISANQLEFQTEGKWLTYSSPVKVDLGLSRFPGESEHPKWFETVKPFRASSSGSSPAKSSPTTSTTVVETADWVRKGGTDYFVAPYAQTVCDTLETWKAPADTSAKEFSDFKSLVSKMKKKMGNPTDHLYSDTYLRIYALGDAAVEYETKHPNDTVMAYSVSSGLFKNECLPLNFVYKNSKFGVTSDGKSFKSDLVTSTSP